MVDFDNSVEGREGPSKAPATTPPGTRLYVFGDIHGCSHLLHDKLRKIAALEGGPARQVMIFLGDYVDRGPDSAGVIDILLEDLPQHMEIVTLMGNHERFMLDFLEGYSDGLAWLINGGAETVLSYGLETRGMSREEGRSALRRELLEDLPRAHLNFLQSLVPHWREGGYYFVHAGIAPGIPLEDQDEDDILWIREPFLSSTQDHGTVIVHGHSITQDPVIRANRIGIDTGASMSDQLTCLVLEDDRMWFL